MKSIRILAVSVVWILLFALAPRAALALDVSGIVMRASVPARVAFVITGDRGLEVSSNTQWSAIAESPSGALRFSGEITESSDLPLPAGTLRVTVVTN